MGEILGLGITHQPTLAAREIRPASLRNTLRDPGLPERYRTPAGWPKAMRREWADDDGARAGAAHRDAIVAELRKARQALDEFAPDFLLVWGDDQYENFREDCVPPFCILAYDAVDCQPWAERPAGWNVWNEPADKTFAIKGHRSGAKLLASGLLGADFDVAYAYRPLHSPLGHAFLNTVLYLDWDRRGFDYPLVPCAVNCYGRQIIAVRGYMPSLDNPLRDDELDPPSPSPRRCFDLGAACARVLAASPWRVALVASSSWSHAFLTRKNYYLHPDHEADQLLYAALQRGDYETWRQHPLAAVEASGQHELLSWFCLAGAMAELERPPTYTAYLESSTMNSNKVVAVFRP
jgi:Catalytic LigB subunit of aromatic ring-opening dioxygenase